MPKLHRQLRAARRKRRAGEVPHYVYIIRCRSLKTYYVGTTNNFERRMAQHREGKQGAPLFTKIHGVGGSVIRMRVSSRADALNLERELTIDIARRFPTWTVAGSLWTAVDAPALNDRIATYNKKPKLPRK